MPVPDESSPIDSRGRLLSEVVFDRIGAAIADGTLAEGEVLRDAELQAWLGVSRTPIREALSRLAVLGLVETAASRYTRVTVVDDALIRDTLVYTGFMAGVAVRMAVPRLTDEQVAQALTLMDAVIDANARDDGDALYATARALVRFMAAHAGNRIFIAVMRETGLMTERNLRDQRPALGSRAERAEWYLKLREAIEERDGDYAEYAFRRQHQLVETAVGAPAVLAEHAG